MIKMRKTCSKLNEQDNACNIGECISSLQGLTTAAILVIKQVCFITYCGLKRYKYILYIQFKHNQSNG